MTKSNKVIFHIDMDAFFASCAELKDSKLKTTPIVIAYNSYHSIVTTANYLARSYGIKTAMPLQQAKKFCPNLKIVEPDYEFIVQQAKNLLRKSKFYQLMNIYRRYY